MTHLVVAGNEVVVKSRHLVVALGFLEVFLHVTV